jgi:Xaa-Pro aminopeptidase
MLGMVGLDRQSFERRRADYMARIGPRAVAVVPSPPEVRRNENVFYPYRQASDLYYLTGFAEPGTTLVLRPGAPAGQRCILFVRPSDPEREIWDGRRAGVAGALERVGVELTFPAGELRDRLPELICNLDDLYYSVGHDDRFDRMVNGIIANQRRRERSGQRAIKRIVDPRLVLHEMRLYKSAEEVALLRRAIEITAEGHREVMRMAAAGITEFQIEAALSHVFQRHGGRPGYPPIVGSGDNATILHYVDNDSTLRDGQLVLVDAGCEYCFYNADVTRTFPVSGRFSPAQRRAYEMVLEVQEAAIAMAVPGVTLDQIHWEVVRRLTEGMVSLGLLAGPAADRVEDGSYRRFYMHRTSHWLGMDVHDVGAYTEDGEPRRLEPGMVITIEPGLYVSASAEPVPTDLAGMGIRIEDDVLVTITGNEILTKAIPKHPDQVEAACNG